MTGKVFILVSVVMTTYNGEKFVEEQLLSIYNQTRKPDEVMIADDGSTDRTVEIVTDFINARELDSWKVWVNPANLGYAKNFIETSIKATGDIIFFSDQDDVWDERKIELMSGLMEKNEKIYALLCNRGVIDKEGNILAHMVYKGFPNYALTNLSMYDCFGCRRNCDSYMGPGMCMSVRKEVIDAVSNLTIPYTAHDFVCKCIAATMNGFYFYNEVLACHRRHSDNTSPAKMTGSRRRQTREARATGLEWVLKSGITAQDVLSGFTGKEDVSKEIKYYDNYIKAAKSRLEIFQGKKLFPAICMLRYVPRYISFKDYLIDIAYISGLEKYL